MTLSVPDSVVDFLSCGAEEGEVGKSMCRSAVYSRWAATPRSKWEGEERGGDQGAAA